MNVNKGIESGIRKINDKATNLPTGPTLTADSPEKPASTTNLPTGPRTSRLHTKVVPASTTNLPTGPTTRRYRTEERQAKWQFKQGGMPGCGRKGIIQTRNI